MRYRALGILAAIPVWIAILALLSWTVAQAVARYAFNSILLSTVPPPQGYLSWDDAIVGWAWWAFLISIPFAAAFVLLDAFADKNDDDGDDVRSRLAVWPGLPLAIVLAAVALFAGGASNVPPTLLLQKAVIGAETYSFLGVAFAVAAAAGLTGGRPMRGVAATATPLVLVTLLGFFADQSITRLLFILAFPCLLIAVVCFVIALATQERGAIWWSLGFFIIPIVALACNPGLVTPTEAAAIIAIVALPIGLIINTAVRQTSAGTAVIVAAAEVSALAAAVVASAMISFVLAMTGATTAIAAQAAAIPPIAQLAIALLIALVGSYLLTPALSLGLIATIVIPLLKRSGLDPSVFCALAVLAASSAMMLRSVRSRHAPPPVGAGLATFQLPIAIGLAVLILLVMVLTAVALLYLSLAPAR